MGIQIYRDISVDFSNARYIIMNAKQYDSKSRFIRMSCNNMGMPVNLNPDDYSAFIRYRKSDGYGVFNKCIISTDGKVIFELTEQMLSTVGTSYADLVILDVNKSDINTDVTIISSDGRIIENNGSLASTMTFYINVMERPLNDDDIISTNEFSALNELLLKASTDYDYIVQTAQGYADEAYVSKNNAARSATAASNSATAAATSEANAQEYRDSARGYLDDVEEFAAQITSDTNRAEGYANDAQAAANTASSSATNAQTSASNSEIYSNMSKSYAIGEGNARQDEATDNSKFYALQSQSYAQSAATSEANAATSLSAAQDYIDEKYEDIEDIATQVATNAQNAQTSATNAATSANNASDSATAASTSESNAQTYAQNAKDSEDTAKDYADSIESRVNDAETAATNAENFADSAEESYQNVLAYDVQSANYAKQAKSYAVGGTDFRPNEDVDNAAYYYDQLQRIITGLSGGLFPMGTITFSVLENQTKQQGYMYNISDNFVSTNTFKDGGGIPYAAGTNVYYTADGFWDALSAPLLLGVKGDAENNFRRGYVNITADNVNAYTKQQTYTKTEVDNLLSDMQDNVIASMQDTISDLQDIISNLTTRLVELEKLNNVTLMSVGDN